MRSIGTTKRPRKGDHCSVPRRSAKKPQIFSVFRKQCALSGGTASSMRLSNEEGTAQNQPLILVSPTCQDGSVDAHKRRQTKRDKRALARAQTGRRSRDVMGAGGVPAIYDVPDDENLRSSKMYI
ncbi:hypothetical protein MRX96_059523 [Rhipicephalus microplus]